MRYRPALTLCFTLASEPRAADSEPA